MDATCVSGYWTTWVTHYYINFYNSLVMVSSLNHRCIHKSETTGCLSMRLIFVQHCQFMFACMYVCMYVYMCVYVLRNLRICAILRLCCAFSEFLDCVPISRLHSQSRDCVTGAQSHDHVISMRNLKITWFLLQSISMKIYAVMPDVEWSTVMTV